MTAEMTEAEQNKEAPTKARRPRKHRAGSGMTASLLLAALALTLAGLVLSGQSLPMPERAKAAVSAAINDRLTDGNVTIKSLSMAFHDGRTPRATLQGLVIAGADGNTMAALNRVEVDLSPGALLQGRFSADRVSLEGAQITVRRRADGSFSLQEPGAATEASPISIGQVLELLDTLFDTGPLATLTEVEAQAVVISLEDARSGRLWQATNARLTMRERSDGITVALVSDVFNGTDDVGEVQVSFAFDDTSRDTEIGFRLRNMPAADIALQSPALGWLGVLDAPLAGAVRATIAGNGRLTSLDGTLDIEQGVVQPDGRVAPVHFDAARAYFTFDPERARLDFGEIGIRSEAFRITASGHTYLTGEIGDWSEAFIGQFNVSEAEVRSDTAFDAPVSIDRMRTDVRLTLSPFSLEIADAFVEDGDVQAHATGLVSIQDGAWRVAVDAESDAIDVERVTAFWPRDLAPQTRGWLSRNIRTGKLSDVSFGVRYTPGIKPDLSLSFGYKDAELNYLADMPRVQDSAGRATLHEHEFVIEVDKGRLRAPDGGDVSTAGTVFSVPDTRAKPVQGVLALAAEGTLSSILEIVDLPPLRLMERAGRTAALATASAKVEANVSLPLKDGIGPQDVNYDVRASTLDLASDRLVPGRQLSARALTLRATPDGVSIGGRGTLDGMPFETTWRLPLGGEAGPGSYATGSATLNADTLAAFGVSLPAQTLRGKGRVDYELALQPNQAPRLKMSSDLRGLGVSLPALGWSKAPPSAGGLELEIDLGPVPDVTKLEFSAPGLALSGDVDFNQEGEVTRVRLPQLRVGDWLDVAARLRPRPDGAAPVFEIDGGRLDLRALPDPVEPGQNTAASAPINLELDTVVVSDSISLAPFRGQITPSSGGLDGQFQARVAGRTLVRGTLLPVFGRTALRLEADDAGGVLRDAGLTPNGRDGSFRIVVTPVRDAPAGTYDGEFSIANMRLEDAPVLAGLLNAISVVGLLDELSGNGLGFDVIDGTFRITPDRIILQEFAAIGPSLGISAEGIYDPATKELDMQGVVSPIYFVNGIGALLTRRGEGLFGFSYRLTGPTTGPRISVNPLSILTPGMFREIFRRPMPTE